MGKRTRCSWAHLQSQLWILGQEEHQEYPVSQGYKTDFQDIESYRALPQNKPRTSILNKRGGDWREGDVCGWLLVHLTPALGMQKGRWLCEFEASLVYIESFRTA